MGFFTRSNKEKSSSPSSSPERIGLRRSSRASTSTASAPTTPPQSSASAPQLRSPQTPQQPTTPPTPSNSVAQAISNFRDRSVSLHDEYTAHRAYFDSSIARVRSGGQTPQQAREFNEKLIQFEATGGAYRRLIDEIFVYIRGLHPHTAKKVPGVLVLGHNKSELVVKCPYCERIHVHKCKDPALGVPLVYHARCGEGEYRAVFPGDIDDLTKEIRGLGVGLQVHNSGVYWMAVAKDVPDVKDYFIPDASGQKKGTSALRSTSTDVDELTQQLGDLKIEEKKTWYPKTEYQYRNSALVAELQSIARKCLPPLEFLLLKVGYYKKPNFVVDAETWNEAGRVAESQSKMGVECHLVDKAQNKKYPLGKVVSFGFRVMCACIRDDRYRDLSLGSGLREEEQIESNPDFKYWQLRNFVRALAEEVGHEFPNTIPKSAGWWKQEMEATRNTVPQDWYCCHAEKKMLVKYLLSHTTWIPRGLPVMPKMLHKKREDLGPEIGHLKGGVLTRKMKFWVSHTICDDCNKFITLVGRRFNLHLHFQVMTQSKRA